MRLRLPPTLLAGLALASITALAVAQIEWLDLPKMVQKSDRGIVGTITDRHVVRFDHEIDGPDLFFTHLTIEGHDLATGEERTAVVTFAGGFINEREGVYNSEAPPADATRLGRRVVAFYAYSDNLGGDLAGHALYASHGGLYQTVTGRGGEVIVIGQGDGYAISHNTRLTELRERVAILANEFGK